MFSVFPEEVEDQGCVDAVDGEEGDGEMACGVEHGWGLIGMWKIGSVGLRRSLWCTDWDLDESIELGGVKMIISKLNWVL